MKNILNMGYIINILQLLKLVIDKFRKILKIMYIISIYNLQLKTYPKTVI